MNVKLRLVVLSLSVAGLAACASMPAQQTAQAPQRASNASNVMDIDQEYVAYVERVARRRGIDVTWVHQPRAQLPRTAADE